jgi:hypothetical protein
MTATQELVVPRSMPITLAILYFLLSTQDRRTPKRSGFGRYGFWGSRRMSSGPPGPRALEIGIAVRFRKAGAYIFGSIRHRKRLMGHILDHNLGCGVFPVVPPPVSDGFFGPFFQPRRTL